MPPDAHGPPGGETDEQRYGHDVLQACLAGTRFFQKRKQLDLRGPRTREPRVHVDDPIGDVLGAQALPIHRSRELHDACDRNV